MDDPFLCFVPSLVESKQTSLSSTLDKLVRLCYKLGVEDPTGELGVGGDGVGLWIPRDLSDLGGGESKLCLDLSILINGRSTLEPVCEQELCVVLPDRCVCL